MSDWTRKLFIKRSDLFLKLLDQRWPRTAELVDGMVRVLGDNKIKSGNVLDLCCGNGRISIHLAKRGFKAVGIDISRAFLEDARRKADENGVSRSVAFLEGDARRLQKVLRQPMQRFDAVVNAWTSIGYYSEEDDLAMFKQARGVSKKTSILFVAETAHTEYLSLKFVPTSYAEIDDMVMLENRKYDPIKGQANTSWIFYRRRGKNLEFIDSIDLEHHVYSPTELSSLLRKAGWETLAFYSNLATLQPMSPLSHLNLVAKAI